MKNNAEKLEDYEVIIDEPPIKMKKSMSEETKKNFNTLMQPCGVLEADFALKKQFTAYSESQLEKTTNRIKQCVYNITSNFIEIGFRLWECEHYHYYSEMGYESVCDYAAAELGFKKSSTRNFIRVYDRFCNHDIVKRAAIKHNHGYSRAAGIYCLLDEYKNFSYSQLAELLSLSDEQIKVIEPKSEDTIKQLREKKKELAEAKEKWLHDTIIDVVCGKLGFKRQLYECYCDDKDIGKLASLIGERMREKRKTERCIDVNGGSCTIELNSLTLFHNVYDNENYRFYDIAERIVQYIDQGTFIEEQVHIDEIAEELSEEMIVTAPELEEATKEPVDNDEEKLAFYMTKEEAEILRKFILFNNDEHYTDYDQINSIYCSLRRILL